MTTGGEPNARLEAIVLAAGFGSRFGGGKLSVPWRGGRLIDGALATAFAAPVRTVTVVTGADPNVAAAARAFAHGAGQTHRLRVIHAVDHARGMSASLKTGIAGLPYDAAGAFVFLGDMPAVRVDTLTGLINAMADGARAAAPVYRGQRGHPVLFSRALFASLAGLTGDEGARGMLAGLGDALALWSVDDPGVLVDIDRPEDLDHPNP